MYILHRYRVLSLSIINANDNTTREIRPKSLLTRRRIACCPRFANEIIYNKCKLKLCFYPACVEIHREKERGYTSWDISNCWEFSFPFPWRYLFIGTLVCINQTRILIVELCRTDDGCNSTNSLCLSDFSTFVYNCIFTFLNDDRREINLKRNKESKRWHPLYDSNKSSEWEAFRGIAFE